MPDTFITLKVITRCNSIALDQVVRALNLTQDLKYRFITLPSCDYKRKHCVGKFTIQKLSG
jgi:hypothetical protein